MVLAWKLRLIVTKMVLPLGFKRFCKVKRARLLSPQVLLNHSEFSNKRNMTSTKVLGVLQSQSQAVF